MSFQRLDRNTARIEMGKLVDAYRSQAAQVEKANSRYTETEARGEFIDRFLTILGWDIHNADGRSQSQRDVVLEHSRHADDSVIGRPDYRLRIGGRDRLPIEAKKPAVNLSRSASAAYQARIYGWSLSLPAAVLTNFSETVIFDTKVTPDLQDGPDVAVFPGCRFTFEDYVPKFDDLWKRMSYEVVSSERFAEVYNHVRPARGDSPFDKTFLAEFRRWRNLLSAGIAQENPHLGAGEVGRRTQRLLNALLFLRVCEDRDIGRYEELLQAANMHHVVEAFRNADRVYNAGLFTVLDDPTVVKPQILQQVIQEMYWPKTKFAFGVFQPEILAELYEQYLAERIEVLEDRTTRLVAKPELVHAGGVVPTPEWIVNLLIEGSIDQFIKNSIPDDLSIIDPACGSGVFLVAVLNRLIEAREYDGTILTLDERAKLALRHVFGMDVDAEAVEVARLSLLLTVLGSDQIDTSREIAAMPDLRENVQVGNSLVREDFDVIHPVAARDPHRRSAVLPTDQQKNFSRVFAQGGFSVVLGNPPYVRIQTLSEFMPDQLFYFQDARSGLKSAQAYNFDIYLLFVERAFDLLGENGSIAFILPNRITNLIAAAPVRSMLGPRLRRMVHFGENQIFPGRSTYTALVFAGDPSAEDASLEIVRDVDTWRAGAPGDQGVLKRNELISAPWPVATAAQSEIFQLLEKNRIAKIGDPSWVNVFVGTQTSADEIFYIKTDNTPDANGLVHFTDYSGEKWKIEPGILRPATKKQIINPYDLDPEPDQYGIFPYTVTLPSSGKKRGNAVVHTRDIMENRFPHALEYLTSHKKRLTTERNVTPDPGEKFWSYGRSQSLTKLDGPKIIVRTLSLTPCYALDENNLLIPGGGDGGPYYLMRPAEDCPYPAEVIIAVMSHPAVDAYVAGNGKAYRGSYIVHRGNFLKSAPVPPLTLDEIELLRVSVREMLHITKSLRTETDSLILRSQTSRKLVLRSQVESIISKAFGLTQRHLDTLT